MNTKKELNNANISQMITFLGAMISSVASFIWLAFGRVISYANLTEEKGTNLSNIMIFGIALIIFGIVYLSTTFILNRYAYGRFTDIFESKRTCIILSLVYVVLLAFLFFALLLEDKYVEPIQTSHLYRHNQFFPIYMLFLGLGVNALIAFINRDEKSKKWLRMILVFFLTVTVVCITFIPNPIDLYGGAYHYDAYINSIMNVSAHVPYSNNVNSIYGHYGLLFLIPIKIFRLFTPTKWHAISLAIALVGGATYALFMLVVNRFVKRDAVFYVTAFAVGYWSFGFCTGDYYQNFPHRWFFQALTLFFVMNLLEKPNSKLRRRMVVIIAVLAIIWNTETGIVCAGASLVVLFVLRYQNNEKLHINIIKSIFELLFVLLGAFGVVELYNISVGGHWLSIKEYIFPLASNVYRIGGLQLPLDIPVSLYFLYTTVFATVFCVYGYKLIRKEKNSKVLFLWLCSVIGLGVFSYYINKVCAGNMQISTAMFIIILAIFVDGVPDFSIRNVRNIKNVLGRFAVCVLMVFTLESVFRLDDTVLLLKHSLYDVEPLHQLLDQIGELPEGTNVVGLYASVLCMCVSESNMVYVMDWEDMHAEAQAYYYNETMSNPDIKYILASNYASYSSDVKLMFPNAITLKTYRYVDQNGTEFAWDLYELNR